MYFNVNATPSNENEKFPVFLSQQITSTVKWRQTIESMENESENSTSINKFIEIGPGSVLTGLVKRIVKKSECFSIQNPEDMDNLNK